MNLFTRSLLVLSLLAATSVSADEPPQDGQLQKNGDIYQAWHEASGKWVSPEDFWLAYAVTRGGLSWGRTATYPPYEQVNEHDTLLVETGHGPCLMEFFHSRWRRANDVRRWDEGFNDYGGCPYVFD